MMTQEIVFMNLIPLKEIKKITVNVLQFVMVQISLRKIIGLYAQEYGVQNVKLV